jgi:branched-chain amino acid aminotransferase
MANRTLIFHRDLVVPEEQLQLHPGNRAFRYGDAVFETLRICKGQPLFFPHHYSRFILGLETLRMDIPEHWQLDFLRRGMQDLARESGMPNARLRMTAWRQGEGRYLPERQDPELLMQIEPLPEPFYGFPLQGLRVDLAEGLELGNTALSRVKSANSLPYVLAAMQARERGLDDLLLQNAQGHLVEASSSNLFLFRRGELVTPPEEDGGIGGVLQRVLIKIARKEGIALRRVSIGLEDLLEADEAFLSNVISGIRWIGQFRQRSYANQFSLGLFGKLEEKVLADLAR